MKDIASAMMGIKHFSLGINLTKLEPEVADDPNQRVGVSFMGTLLLFSDSFSTPVARTEATCIVIEEAK